MLHAVGSRALLSRVSSVTSRSEFIDVLTGEVSGVPLWVSGVPLWVSGVPLWVSRVPLCLFVCLLFACCLFVERSAGAPFAMTAVHNCARPFGSGSDANHCPASDCCLQIRRQIKHKSAADHAKPTGLSQDSGAAQ